MHNIYYLELSGEHRCPLGYLFFFQKTIWMCAISYFFLVVCNKPHANPTIIYENIKEIHILAVGGILEFPILSHMLLRRELRSYQDIHLS